MLSPSFRGARRVRQAGRWRKERERGEGESGSRMRKEEEVEEFKTRKNEKMVTAEGRMKSNNRGYEEK